jgi:hypothetical protein
MNLLNDNQQKAVQKLVAFASPVSVKNSYLKVLVHNGYLPDGKRAPLSEEETDDLKVLWMFLEDFSK